MFPVTFTEQPRSDPSTISPQIVSSRADLEFPRSLRSRADPSTSCEIPKPIRACFLGCLDREEIGSCSLGSDRSHLWPLRRCFPQSIMDPNDFSAPFIDDDRMVFFFDMVSVSRFVNYRIAHLAWQILGVL